MGDRLKSIGTHTARYGLVVVLLWIGGMKFTSYEAEGIRPLVANSPLLSWVYRAMSVGGFSSLLGVFEISVGVLIALRPVWPLGSAIGSGFAAGMFLTTLSFLITTPGWEASLGFPALSASPGQFLIKDVVLLGVAIFHGWRSGGWFERDAASKEAGRMPHTIHDIGVASQIGKYSDAIEVGANLRWLVTSGTPGLSMAGDLPDDIESQAERAWEHVIGLLERAGMTAADVVKVTQYLTRAEDIPAYAKVRSRFLGDERPASMLLVVPQLVRPGFLVEVEIVAAKA